MERTQLAFTSRIRNAVVAGFSSLLLLGTALSGTAIADQTPPTQTSSSQSVSQSVEAIGPHTHQIHGTLKTAPVAGSTTFVVTTERHGDVTVSFAGTAARGHGHGHGRGRARAFEITSSTDLKAGERVVVQGRTSPDGKTFVARRVHVLPAKDGAAHPNHLTGTISGVTTSNGTTTLTVKLTDGTTQAVTLSADTRIRPQGKTLADLTVGTKVTVVSRNGTATGVVVLPA
jgi:hypothetical protein